MTAAILCPGPSLSGFAGSGRFSLKIGVNRAVVAFPCDVFCACDYQIINQIRDEVVGWPVLFTNSPSAARVRWHKTETFESISGADGKPLSVSSFSAIAAVWYAVAKGARRIEVFGADLSGQNDFDGVAAGENRTNERWARERELWESTADVLAARGILLIRHRSHEEPTWTIKS